VREQFY
jgi:hypothetical protein